MGDEFDADYWEDHYRAGGHQEVGPSPYLEFAAAAITPGSALDAGCGEGGNAIWLAAHGWRVTAVDISATALTRARQHAARFDRVVSGRIEWIESDLTAWSAEPGHYDFVTAHYVHPRAGTAGLIARLAGAVALGGTLLIVDHDARDAHAHAQTSLDDLAAALQTDLWDVEVRATRPRHANPHGHWITLWDNVLRARRCG